MEQYLAHFARAALGLSVADLMAWAGRPER